MQPVCSGNTEYLMEEQLKCKNHFDRDAVGRCKQCHKPICSECAMSMETGIFCSDACYRTFKFFYERIKSRELKKPKPKPAVVVLKSVAYILALLIIGGGTWLLYKSGSIEGAVQKVKSIISGKSTSSEKHAEGKTEEPRPGTGTSPKK
jgi:hypothetical protein